MKKLIRKALHLKLVILFVYENIKIYFQKAKFQVDLKKLWLLRELKILCHGHTLLVTLTVKNLLEQFMKKNCKKEI